MGLDNPIHILIILIAVLLLFGAKRLPEIGRSLGEGMRGFKDSLHGEVSQTTLNATPAPVPTPVPVAPPVEQAVAAEPPVAPPAV